MLIYDFRLWKEHPLETLVSTYDFSTYFKLCIMPSYARILEH